MSVIRWAKAARGRRLLAAGLLVAATAGTPATAEVSLHATYYIALAGFNIGRVSVASRLAEDGYYTVIDGSTFGLSRLVSDARAVLTGNGAIDGTRVSATSYSFINSEDGRESRVNMALHDGTIIELAAEPTLRDTPDRIPLTDNDRQQVVDPVSAFIVSLGSATEATGDICERTVRVFDGWQRFDIELAYDRTERVVSRRGSYSGPVIVCSARYVPVAGHRLGRESIEYMANNERLEVWMAPVAHTSVMIPHRIVIGTTLGDLTVSARQFEVKTTERQASIQ
jgi:hypothetical protein